MVGQSMPPQGTVNNKLTDTEIRKLFGATALKSTAASVNLIADIFLAEVPKLRNVTGGVVTIGFQMIAQSALHAARESGGDAINLDPQDGAIMSESTLRAFLEKTLELTEISCSGE